MRYDELEISSVEAPADLRIISYTTFAGISYEDVAEVRYEERITAFYYSRTDGLLRVERANGTAFFRVE